jgi:hypothetical protein
MAVRRIKVIKRKTWKKKVIKKKWNVERNKQIKKG